MSTKFVSNYTEEERAECVKDYFKGTDKEKLARKWGVSKRTIERWIKEYERINPIEINIAKRSKLIPVDIQLEIMQILKRNPILYGFNISIWNESMIIKLLKDNYNIKITRYMARLLLKDRQPTNNEYEEKALNEINELEQLGYKFILLDYIRFGRINKRDIEPLFYKKFMEHKLDLNLGIARGCECAYIDIIFSEIDIIEKTNKITLVEPGMNIKADRKQRNAIIEDKLCFINKVLSKESKGNNVVFISKEDADIEKVKNEKAVFYIVNKQLHEQLIQDEYENDERYSLVEYLYNANKEYKRFKSYEEIRNEIKKKISKYALELENKIHNEVYMVKDLEIKSKIKIF